MRFSILLRRRRSYSPAFALLAALFALAGTSASAQERWTRLEALEQRGARVSAVALDLDSGKPIASFHADERLSPASLSKVVTAAAALQTWSPNEQFDTSVLAGGPIRSGILEGDLILRGAGDASLDGSDLWTLAAQVRRAGILSVTGGVRVLPAPFGQLDCETKDRCDALARSDRSYVAMLSSMGIDYGNWCVEVRPTAVGEPAEITACHAVRLPIPVYGSVRTVAAGGKRTFWVERIVDEQGDALRVQGDIPQGPGQRLYRSMSEPSLGAGKMFAQIVRDMGVTIVGPERVEDGPLPAAARELGTVQGLTLGEQIGRMLQHSNNFIADVLTLNLAAVARRQSPKSLAEAGEVLSRFVLRANGGEALGAVPPLLLSGSGLTPESRISANELVGVLQHMYADTSNFPTFYGGLVVPRQGPYAFIRRGSTAWRERVALKTGTMSEPYSVSGLAGYLRKRNGGWIAFVTIVNGSDKIRRVPLSQAIDAARGDIEALLAKY